MSGLDEACRMLDVFVSVGAKTFDLTHINIDGEKRGFRRAQTAGQLKNSLRFLIPAAIERQNNIIIRPHRAHLVQLDDLDTENLARVASFSFLTVTTSPGNHQAWIAFSESPGKEVARRLRKGCGADPTASGAVRLAGSFNFKRKYEPAFPAVSIISTAPDRIVTPEEVETLGLTTAPEPMKPTHLRISTLRSWPDYHRCIAGAPLNRAGDAPDVSRADYLFARLAAQRGWAVEEIAARLMELSIKAKTNGEAYAHRTASNASSLVGLQSLRQGVDGSLTPTR